MSFLHKCLLTLVLILKMPLKIILFFHVSQAGFFSILSINTKTIHRLFYFDNTMNTATQKVSGITNYHQTKIKIQQKGIKLFS